MTRRHLWVSRDGAPIYIKVWHAIAMSAPPRHHRRPAAVVLAALAVLAACTGGDPAAVLRNRRNPRWRRRDLRYRAEPTSVRVVVRVIARPPPVLFADQHRQRTGPA